MDKHTFAFKLRTFLSGFPYVFIVTVQYYLHHKLNLLVTLIL